MSALRLGRSSVRFLHSYPAARVSYLVGPLSVHQYASYQSRLAKSIYATIRSYADKPVSRPKQHTGRAPARKPRATSTTKKSDAKARATTSTTKKSDAKARATSTRTKAPKKKVPAKKPKKKLTPEQKERKEVRDKRQKVADLKKRSLKNEEPAVRSASAWIVFLAERLKGAEVGRAGLAEHAKDAANKFHNLSPGEREHYNHFANQQKAAATEAYAQWVQALSPTKIRDANQARKQLKTLGFNGYARQIKDSRTPKPPASSYLLFSIERRASGDFKGVSIPDSSRLIAQEWKNAPASEKKRLEDAAQGDYERYVSEYRAAYNSEPRQRQTSSKTSPS